MGENVNVEANDTAFTTDELEHGGGELEGAALGQARLGGPFELHFLNGQDVLCELDDEAAHSGGVTGVLMGLHGLHKVIAHAL